MLAGVHTFRLPKNLSIHRFAKVFPDQNEYLTRWAKHLKVRTVQELMTKLRYREWTGTLEHVHMHSARFSPAGHSGEGLPQKGREEDYCQGEERIKE